MYISQNKFDLNLPLFIARRMRLNPKFKGSVSVQIIKIAKVAVALGITMILIAVATGKGLQEEIQNKTVAFNGHLVVAPFENSESMISILPIENDIKIFEMLKKRTWCNSRPKVALKGGLLKSGNQFEGIVFKGVTQDYQWQLLKSFWSQVTFLSSAKKPPTKYYCLRSLRNGSQLL